MNDIRQPANGFNAFLFILLIIGLMYCFNYWVGVGTVTVLALITLATKIKSENADR